MQDKKDEGDGLGKENDDLKCKVDSDDYEELMHEQSEEGTAPDNES